MFLTGCRRRGGQQYNSRVSAVFTYHGQRKRRFSNANNAGVSTVPAGDRGRMFEAATGTMPAGRLCTSGELCAKSLQIAAVLPLVVVVLVDLGVGGESEVDVECR